MTMDVRSDVPAQQPRLRTHSARSLYRVEYDGDFQGRRPPFDPSSWLHQGLRASGAWDSVGRWFGTEPETLDFHTLDVGEHFRVLRIDATAEQCAAWSLEAQPEAARYSLDRTSEYFVSRDAAEGAVRDPEMETVLRARVFGSRPPSA